MGPYGRVLLALIVAATISCGGDGGDSGTPTSPSGGGGGGCSLPGSPGNLTASVSFTSAVFSWSAVSGARDYFIMVGTSPNTSGALATNTTQTTYNWNGIPRGTYYVRVEARNSCGSGRASNEVSFTIG